LFLFELQLIVWIFFFLLLLTMYMFSYIVLMKIIVMLHFYLFVCSMLTSPYVSVHVRPLFPCLYNSIWVLICFCNCFIVYTLSWHGWS
jgi:hypothetical protein